MPSRLPFLVIQAQVKHEEDGAPFAGLINSSSVSADAPDPTLSNAAVMGKVAASGSRTTNITVRTFTDSSGGSSCLGAIEEQQEQQLLLSSAGSSGLQDNAGGCEEWYDCAEDWQDDDTTAAAAEAAAASEKAQQQAAEELLPALPAELAHILRRYTQVGEPLQHHTLLCSGSLVSAMACSGPCRRLVFSRDELIQTSARYRNSCSST